MKSRKFRNWVEDKINLEAVEICKNEVAQILSDNWEGHITDNETKELILLAVHALAKKNGIFLKAVREKLQDHISEIIEENKTLNNRSLARKKLFHPKYLANDLFSKVKKMLQT